MSFAVSTRTQPGVASYDPTIVVLEGDGCRAEIWPALGFNCFQWQATAAGQALDLLYADPTLFGEGRPSRSGIPVLFPFPNRIRAGFFRWDNIDYQLPRNSGPGVNAIHGFALNRGFRVAAQGSDATSAFVTGVFRGSVNAADLAEKWPADYELKLTYRLTASALRLEVEVSNPDVKPLPWGLGFHPYFRLPFAPGFKPEDCQLTVPATSYWELTESLPTGKVLSVDASRNFNKPRAFPEVNVDDVLTGLPPIGSDGFRVGGELVGAPGVTLRILWTAGFRETVVFTPANRAAFCVEPYTCVTDAINLQPRGVDAGLQVLAPGATWRGVVDMRLA
jgi:aldose 1-epimerase